MADIETQTSAQILAGATPEGLLARAVAGLAQADATQVSLVCWQNGTTSRVRNLIGPGRCPKNFPVLQREGWCLGIYVWFSTGCPWELAAHLSYPVQFCPIPVMEHHLRPWSSASDTRGKYWLGQATTDSPYPPDRMLNLELPLLCDIYLGKGISGPLLLKPGGGHSHSHLAGWCNQKCFEWLKPAGPISSISTLARYYWGPQSIHQEFKWSAQRKLLNSAWEEKPARTAWLTTARGSDILFISADTHADRLLPIADGIALEALFDELKIPGLTLITGADSLNMDVSGSRIVEDVRFKLWLQEKRLVIQEALEKALEIPPTPPNYHWPPLGKTMLATGLSCLLAGILANGFQPSDFLFLTHGGIFGGTAVAAGLRSIANYLPGRGRQEQQRNITRVLQERLQATQQAIASADH
ncbi:MAG: hypothetical protein KF760_24935 [Candidatus Eremiobacteraeota bacterium]|nr:hypothetical protein [Candidatus Eremiobacteraeota bacterium]